MGKRILLTKYIDHTNLNPTAKSSEIRQLCNEAVQYDFKSVCVHPCKIPVCVEELRNSDVLICTVVGFPLGQNTIASKVFETMDAIQKGANEIDMVINIAELKLGNKRYCINEIDSVVKAAQGRLVKVIVETALLSDEEKALAFEIVNESTAHYIKTSTGFSTSGAKLQDVAMWNEMKQDSGSDLKIKAAGGVSNYDDLLEFISAGAERIGTSRSLSLFRGHDKMVTVNVVSYVSIKGKEKPYEKIVDETKKKKEAEEKAKKEAKEAKEAEEKANKDSKETKTEQKTETKVEETSKKGKKSKKSKAGSDY